MKFSRTSLGGLRFAAVLVMTLAIHSISAMEETLDGFRRGKDQNSFGGMEDAEKHTQPLRERRAVKNNSTEDILQRLQDLEKKYVCQFCGS